MKVRINGFDVEGTSGEIRELIGMAPAAAVEGDVKKAQTFELQSRMAGMSMQDTISMLVNLLGADNKLQGSMPVNNTVVPEVIPNPPVATEPTPVVMPNGDVLNSNYYAFHYQQRKLILHPTAHLPLAVPIADYQLSSYT